MRSLGFASPNQPRQEYNRLNPCRRRLVGELNSTRRRLSSLARRGPAGRSTRSGGAFRHAFWPGAARRCRPAAQGTLRPNTSYAAPRLSDSNTARMGRGEQPTAFVRRVTARNQHSDSESEPREPRPNRRTVNQRQPGTGLTHEQPGASATPGRRHFRHRNPPGGRSLTARISCVADEPRPFGPTARR